MAFIYLFILLTAVPIEAIYLFIFSPAELMDPIYLFIYFPDSRHILHSFMYQGCPRGPSMEP